MYIGLWQGQSYEYSPMIYANSGEKRVVLILSSVTVVAKYHPPSQNCYIPVYILQGRKIPENRHLGDKYSGELTMKSHRELVTHHLLSFIFVKYLVFVRWTIRLAEDDFL